MRDPDPDQDLDALLRHGDQVRRLALRLCADAHGVDDAVQDAWLAALRSPPQHRGNVRGWFAVLLRNSVRQRARAERRRDARHAATARDERVEATDEAVARAELHQRLVACVLELGEPQRSLVLLHYFEGIDVGSLAAQRALTADAVRAHLRRARAELRTRLCAEPRSRRALRGLAAGVDAVTGTAAVAATMVWSVVMKKLIAGAVVAAAAAAALWFAVDWRDVAAPPAVRSDGAVAPATAAVADESAAARAPGRTALPAATTDATAANVPFTVALRGLHPDAPWTATVHLDLDGRDEEKNEWLEFPAHGVPGPDGELALALPPWATTHFRKLRVRADDPNYLEFDLREEGALPASRRWEIDVQVVAVLTGRVVDEHGAPVPAARVAAFAVVADEPRDSALWQTNTAADGTFVLQAPPATPLLLVAAAMEEAKLSGMRMTGRHGAISDVGQFRSDLLPATKTTTGVVGRAVEVGEFVLTKAARIEGVVRWSDGQPAAKVEVGICPRGENRVLALGAGASVQQLLDHTWAPIATAHSDEDGHFALPTAAGALFTLVVCAVPEHLLHGFVGVERLVAPRAADVTLPLPVRIRAVDDGAVVRDAEFLLGDARHRASDREELRVIVGSPDRHGAATVAARAGALRSATATLSSELAGTVLDLPLRRELAAVAIEFTGEFRVRNARFTFAPLDAGEPADERELRDDRSGPFTCWLVPGRYRVYVRPSGGERNGVFLLEQSREFDVPAAGTSLTLPALFGGQLAIEVVDEHGIGIGGQCRVHDSAGQECTGYFRFLGATRMLGIGDTQRSGLKGQLCPRGFSELLRILPPGDYDLELDLGAHGIHRSRATITPRETTTVRVRVP